MAESDVTLDATSPSVGAGTSPRTLPHVPGFEILEELGRGGMGVVYKARQTGLNRVVALKMILAGGHAGPQELTRFRNEAEAVAQLHHENIVQVFESGEHDNIPYLVLEYLSGGNLASATPGQPRPPGEATALVEKLARAVHHAHQRGILHRDLKPGNVLLSDHGEPKLTDFGLAKRLDGEHGMTQSGAILGTPSYMAPEQAAARKDLTTAADVYSLGAILYELLVGWPPFRGSQPLDIVLQVMEQAPAPPRSLNRAIDPGLDRICSKCLEKAPADRYESAAALAEDLRRWQAGEALSVHPPGLLEQFTRWLRRNAVAAFWVIVLGLVWGFVIGVAASLKLVPQYSLRMWPETLFGPVAWVRFAKLHAWFTVANFLLSVGLCLGIGWLLLLLARPRDRRAALGMAAATGLIATLVAFLFVGPFDAVRSRAPVHPVDAESAAEHKLDETLAATRRKTIFKGRFPEVEHVPLADLLPGDREYLEGYFDAQQLASLKNERLTNPLNLYHLLRKDARYVNRLSAAFTGIWTTMFITLGTVLSLALLSVACADRANRLDAPVKARLAHYVELYVPCLLLVLTTAFTAYPVFSGILTDTNAGTLLGLFGLLAFALGTLIAITHWQLHRDVAPSRRAALYVAWAILSFGLLHVFDFWLHARNIWFGTGL